MPFEASESPTPRPRRALVVDGDEYARTVLARTLESGGLVAETLCSGDTAWQTFEAAEQGRREGWDVVVVCEQLFGMSGTALVRRLRGRCAELPILYTSSLPCPEALPTPEREPPIPALCKPFPADVFLQRVTRLAQDSRRCADAGAGAGAE